MNRKNLLLLILLVCSSNLFAQKKATGVVPYSKAELPEAKREAASYFKSENYRMSKLFYERLVATDPRDVDYNHKLALCYLHTNINKSKAIPLLEYVVNSNTKVLPKDVQFELATAYHYGGYFDKALETFEKYRVEKKGTVEAKLKFDRWIKWSSDAKEMIQKPVTAEFINLGKGINSPTPDYKPLIGANDSVVYFTSSRKGNTGGLTDDLGDIPGDVYFFTQGDSTRSKAKNAGININTPLYEEALFLSMTGDKLIIYMEGEVNGDLFMSTLKGKQWNKAMSIGKNFVTKAFESGATLSPDGMTLYFAAEAEGSKTGKDIYKCTRTEQTEWSKPERMGDNINTNEDEDSPYIWLDGKTLFYSSKGRGGMGGYDVFKTVMNNPSEGFGTPENIGYPLNSTYDDMGIAVTVDGRTVYVSQVRDSGIGESDLYKVILADPIVSNRMCLLSGTALSNFNTAAKGGIVTINNSTSGDLIYKTETNEATGKFDLALPSGVYKIAVRHPKLGIVEEEVIINALENTRMDKVFQFK